MSLILELSPEQETLLVAAARKEGIPPAILAARLISEHLPLLTEEDPALALFAQWEQEDADMTPEEIAEENRSWEEFKININAERTRSRARPVF